MIKFSSIKKQLFLIIILGCRNNTVDLRTEIISGCSVARLSRLVWDEEVAGSNPATPTIKALYQQGFFCT